MDYTTFNTYIYIYMCVCVVPETVKLVAECITVFAFHVSRRKTLVVPRLSWWQHETVKAVHDLLRDTGGAQATFWPIHVIIAIP